MDKTVKYGAFCLIKSPNLYFEGCSPRPWILDNFNTIGWPDPFPKSLKQGKYMEPKVPFSDIQSYKESIRKSNAKHLSRDMAF